MTIDRTVDSSVYLKFRCDRNDFSFLRYSLFIQPDGAIITTWWYINIFSRGVWTAFFVSVVCVACSIMMVQHVKKFVYADRKDHDDEFSSPLFNVLYVLGGTTGQGNWRVKPKTAGTFSIYR